jgi:hypothetical protein
MIDPKRHPREHDNENARQICLKNEISYVALELERQRESLVHARCKFLLHVGEEKVFVRFVNFVWKLRLSVLVTCLSVVCLVAHDGELRQFSLFDSPNWRISPVHQYIGHGVAICEAIEFVSRERIAKSQKLTALDLDGAVLRVEWIVVQVHHAGQRRCESHAVGDRAVACQAHELVPLGDVMKKTARG